MHTQSFKYIQIKSFVKLFTLKTHSRGTCGWNKKKKYPVELVFWFYSQTCEALLGSVAWCTCLICFARTGWRHRCAGIATEPLEMRELIITPDTSGCKGEGLQTWQVEDSETTDRKVSDCLRSHPSLPPPVIYSIILSFLCLFFLQGENVCAYVCVFSVQVGPGPARSQLKRRLGHEHQSHNLGVCV